MYKQGKEVMVAYRSIGKGVDVHVEQICTDGEERDDRSWTSGS